MTNLNSKIEWTDTTWSPVTGCTKISAGCDNCYAEGIARRFAGGKAFPNGFEVTLRPHRLGDPLKWRKPRRVFVNSMSDLFHDDIPDEFIAQVFAVMAATPQHTYQILTKRHGRMRSLLSSERFRLLVVDARITLNGGQYERDHENYPLPNTWLGVSVEDQQWADIRIPALLQTPAAVRFISFEPLLGPVQLTQWTTVWATTSTNRGWGYGGATVTASIPGLSWAIVGGESGRRHRPMDIDAAADLIDQLMAAHVAVFVKQDSGPVPGMQGRIPDELWIKQFPEPVW